MKKLLFLPAFLAAFSLLAAPVVEIDFDDAKDYAVNDTLTFKIRVTDEGAPVSCGKLGVVEYSESTGMPFEFKSELALSETGEAEYVTRLDRPGFVRIEVGLKDPEDADKVLARAVCGAQAPRGMNPSVLNFDTPLFPPAVQMPLMRTNGQMRSRRCRGD